MDRRVTPDKRNEGASDSTHRSRDERKHAADLGVPTVRGGRSSRRHVASIRPADCGETPATLRMVTLPRSTAPVDAGGGRLLAA